MKLKKHINTLLFSLAVSLSVTSSLSADQLGERVNNKSLSESEIQERVTDLLSQMTIEEKTGQLTQLFNLSKGDKVSRSLSKKLEKGSVGSVLFVSDAKLSNAIQRVAVEESRLKIPVLFGFDVVHGFRTIFPVPIGMAATWDPDIVRASQAVAATEARSVGISWTFAPMIDINRDPRWGRILEGSGEDPLLGSVMAAAQVEGFQGNGVHNPDSLMAGPKHFVGYGASLGGRDNDEVNLSEYELWNTYLPPFLSAFEAGAGNVMCAYMALNGVPVSGNKWLLTDLLREEIGFKGFVVSDNGCVGNLVTQELAKDDVDATARALNAGVDMSMATGKNAFENIPEAIETGLIDMKTLDASVRRVLEAKYRMGLFDHPFVSEDRAKDVLSNPDHRETARIAAEKSAVLLQNEGGLLPLSRASIKSIAVIGPLADTTREILGPWSFEYDQGETVSILDGIRQKVGDNVKVGFEWGPVIPERLFPSPFGFFAGSPDEPAEIFDEATAIARSVRLAEQSDVAIIVVGEKQDMIGEAASRSTLSLPGAQEQLIDAVAATGKPIVVVLMSARPLDLRRIKEKVPSIIDIWYPGTEGGAAVANLLFGDAVPGGKLPFTWVRSVGQIPNYYAQLTSQSPQNAETRYWDEGNSPLFPFGYGLSYSTFKYDNLKVSKSTIKPDGSVVVSIDLTNTGTCEADEVVQLYIHQRYGSASRPQRELKGFKRVTLVPGETRTIEFMLGQKEFKYWNSIKKDWVVDASVYDIAIGGDSTAEFGATVEIAE